MKVALCISGQPRYIDKSFEQFEKNILSVNDLDIYAHLWWDDSYKGKSFVWESTDKYPEDYSPVDEFSKKFKPKWTLVQPHVAKEDFGYNRFPSNCVFDQSMDSNMVKSIITRQRSQWNSINWSMSHPDLKYYDLIVRARTDLTFEKPIIFSEYTPDKVYMMDGALQCGGDRHYQDWFWFGPYEMMMKINRTYDKILPFYKNGLKHMHELVQHSIESEDIDGEILDLGVYMMKRNSIDNTEQRNIIKNRTEDLQVDLI